MGRFRARIYDSADEVAVGTDELVSRVQAPFYYRKVFLAAYERHPVQPHAGSFYIDVQAAETGELVAAVPCYIQNDPTGWLGFAEDELALLSHTWQCPETRLVAVELSGEILDAVLAAMRRAAILAGVRRYGFINVEAGSPTAGALSECGLRVLPLGTKYRLNLSDVDDEEGYLATIRPKCRREYRRHLRRAEDAGVHYVVKRVTAGEKYAELQIIDWTLHELGFHNASVTGELSAFITSIAGLTRILEVWSGNDILALAVVFVDGNGVYPWVGGYRRQKGLSFSPYYVLHAQIVRMALKHDPPIIFGGRHNDRFKTHFGMEARKLVAYVSQT